MNLLRVCDTLLRAIEMFLDVSATPPEAVAERRIQPCNAFHGPIFFLLLFSLYYLESACG